MKDLSIRYADLAIGPDSVTLTHRATAEVLGHRHLIRDDVASRQATIARLLAVGEAARLIVIRHSTG